jgi:hypothetical protein
MTIAFQSLCDRITFSVLSLPSLWYRSRSLYIRSAIALQSPHNRSTIARQSFCNRCTLAFALVALSQRNRHTIAWKSSATNFLQSLRNHCANVARCFLIQSHARSWTLASISFWLLYFFRIRAFLRSKTKLGLAAWSQSTVISVYKL